MQKVIVFLLLSGLSLAAAQDRVRTSVDPSRSVILKANVHPRAQSRFDQGRADAALPIAYATLHLKPGPGLAAFLAEQQDPASPNFHKWLTPEQFGDRFGLTPSDLAKITDWLKAEGFQVHDIARGRHWVTFSGTAGQVNRSFHTEIHRYLVYGEMHFANATPPSIPEALAGVVTGIRGFDDFRLQSQAQIVPVQPNYNTATGRALAPNDFATIFDLQQLYAKGIDGTGQTIAIIGQTRIVPSDIATFRTRYNLPANPPTTMLFGTDPGLRSADLAEADLDLQWSGAIARNANIVYVYSSDVITSAQYAIDQNVAPVMSLSYGGCEAYNDISVQGVAQQGNAQGITWFASSGDSGAVTCDRNDVTPVATLGPTVSSPASLPEITAVGGTEFTDTTATYWSARNDANSASALSYVPEKAWNDFVPTGTIATWGTGGGPSALFAKPSWQFGPGVPKDGVRDVPDVSFPASGTVPYLAILNGGLVGFGGTSGSSPAFAGLMSLVLQHTGGSGLGNINPALYRLAQSTTDVFHDVTAGDNKAACIQSSPGCVNGLVGFSAGTGYDMATGLGTVDGYNLVMEWSSGSLSSTALSISPNNALNLSDTVQLSAIVAGSGTAPTGSVSFVANDITIATAPLKTADGVTSAGAQVSVLLLAAGNGTVTALYSGDAVYSGSRGSGRLALNMPAGAALVVPFVNSNPVYELAAAGNWPYTVGLSEKAGVDATITSFTVNGVNNIGAFGANAKLPANSTISAGLAGSGLAAPLNRVFIFGGTDANGNKWTQQLTVPFLPPLGSQIAPAISLTSPTTTVQQNPQADASCQWSQQVTVQELGGYPTSLGALIAGTTSFTSQISSIFGTTHLAPFGSLNGTVCFSGTTPPSVKTMQISGTSSVSTTVVATLPLAFTTASPGPATMSLGSPALSLSIASAQGSVTGSMPLNFSGGSPQWTASVSPANRTSSWLTVTPGLASGSSPINLQASAAGLSPGVYMATVNVQATDAVPQVVSFPVTFVVSPSSSTSIAGVGNAFSGGTTVAPGSILSVYGTQLANSIGQATRLPLPLVSAGVTATVNGFPAPLYYVSAGQINLQVPYEAGAGPAALAINNNGQIASFPLTVAAAAPGLLANAYDNATGLPVTSVQAGGGNVLLLFVTGEGDVTPTLGTGATPSATITDPTRLPHSRLPLTLTVGGVTVTPLFAGIPNGLAGTTQIDFQVPPSVSPGKQAVVVTVGGVAAPAIYLNVTPAGSQ
ncbi:MAG TPA: protease pro-enzyme activation domain-containing protein [Candidatus Sulfopaludibacter sp.]|jgi:uncharacterized protein (TIGR03437 family)|nr:protease pro-enzyme activation domain-containing protein [Candidatus Sulfopaludibacter sp.]